MAVEFTYPNGKPAKLCKDCGALLAENGRCLNCGEYDPDSADEDGALAPWGALDD